MSKAAGDINTGSSMQEILEAFPGAQRTLFRHYHIGGCSNCAFQPTETLEQVCARNGSLEPASVLERIRASHEEDSRLLIEPADLAKLLPDSAIRLVDVRSREEFEAVHIEGSALLSQPVMRELLAAGSNDIPVIIIDHQGKQALDAAAYFIGHGLRNIRCLRGGIDAWAREVDQKVRRYELTA